MLKLKFVPSFVTSGLVAEGVVADEPLYVLMPLTYMNESGGAVRQVMTRKNLLLEDVLIVCDDLDLDYGQIRVRARGSDGGHKGLNSVIEHLGTEQFSRVRMGIGRPAGKKDVVEYVLETFKKEEKGRLDDFINEAASCCLVWGREGINRAMDQYNRKS
jgi:PTH1 family peptidyl-tRNA hydrolase